jgi:hypothetical protein
LIEPFVKRVEIRVNPDLRLHRPLAEQCGLPAKKDATIVPVVGVSLVGVNGPELALIAADDRQSLDDGILFVFVKAELFPNPFVNSFFLEALPKGGRFDILRSHLHRADQARPQHQP